MRFLDIIENRKYWIEYQGEKDKYFGVGLCYAKEKRGTLLFKIGERWLRILPKNVVKII